MDSAERVKWLEDRRAHVGGSDTPDIMGEGFNDIQHCYLSKLGILPLEPENNDMKRGTALEPHARQHFVEKTGLIVTEDFPYNYESPRYPWMAANIDGTIMGLVEKRGPGVLEIKCPKSFVWLKYKRSGVPHKYILQMQHYLAVTGWKWGIFTFFNADTWESFEVAVEEDLALQKIIIDLTKYFWYSNVLLKVIPDLPKEDENAVKYPPTDVSGVIKIKPSDIIDAYNVYDEMNSIIKTAGELKKDAKLQMQESLGKLGVFEVPDLVRIHYTESTRSKFNEKRFFAKHPNEDIKQYYDESTSVSFRLYRIKPRREE